MQWNAEADQEILMVIIEKCEIKIPYEDIAQALGCTPKAVTHRIAKIKKTVQEKRQNGGAASTDANANNDNSDEAPITPAKRKRATKKEPKTPKSAKKAKIEDEDDDDQEEDITALLED